jgi:hypothetical protein
MATAVWAIASVIALPVAQTGDTRQWSTAEIFVELNDTDDDLGLHASIDGEPWTRLEIEGPGELALLNLFSRGRLSAQGLTQFAFESGEPTFDELAPRTFFRRFPEGRYKIAASTPDGTEIEGVAILSHVLAAPPEHVLVSGLPAAENCDTPLPHVRPPVRIEWDSVTTSHPDIGKPGSVTIDRYQLFVERAGMALSFDLPPTVTSVEVPELITSAGMDFKFEIIARTTRGNNTAVESCFVVL